MADRSSTLNSVYEFGSFRLDAGKRVLLRDGHAIPLTPKTFETLLVLVQNAGRPISRDDLMSALWPDAFVEEGNLTQNISVLRKALGVGNRYIVTLPGRGYQFIEQVREVEEEKEEPTPPPVAETRPAAARKEPRKNFRWALALLIFLTAASLTSFLLHRRRSGGEIPAELSPAVQAAAPTRRSVAVLGFRNSSGRASDQWISTAVAEMLNTELGAGNQVRMISAEDVARARVESNLPDVASLSKPSLQRLREQLGTDLVVLGSYSALPEKGGERLRFDVRLQDTATGETIAEQSATGSREQLFQLAGEMGSLLRRDAGIPGLSKEESGEVRAAAISNPQAMRLYAQGLDKLRAFDARAARDLLAGAVAAEPGQPLFHSALAESWSALGYDVNAQAEAKKAFGLSRSASRKDQLLVEGRYRELTRDLPAAAEIYRTLWNFFPDDPLYGLRLGAVQIENGQGKEALSTVARLRRLPPPENEDPRIDLVEAKAAESQSDYRRYLQSASAAAAKAQARGSRLILADALHEQGYAYDRLGHPERAIAAYRQARELWAAAGNQYSATSNLGIIAVEQYYSGDFAAAARSFEEALAVFRRIGAQWALASCSHNYAMLLKDEGKLAEAKRALEQALRIQRDLRDERGVAADLDDLGNVQFSLGQLDAAVRSKRQAAAMFHRVGNRLGEAITLSNLGEVLFAQGKLAGAHDKFEQSLQIKQQIGYKRGLGFCWVDLAEVLRAQDRLPQARATAQQAMTLRQQLGDEFNLAQSQMQVAEIAVEEGKAAEAESLARSAAGVFARRKISDSGAIAYAVLTRALLAQGKTGEAEAAGQRAAALAEKGGDQEARFQADLAVAALDAALGKRAQADQLLQSVLSFASRHGYAAHQLEARLELGELELRSGNQGRERLARVQSDAQDAGFLLIARKAHAALSRAPAVPRG